MINLEKYPKHKMQPNIFKELKKMNQMYTGRDEKGKSTYKLIRVDIKNTPVVENFPIKKENR